MSDGNNGLRNLRLQWQTRSKQQQVKNLHRIRQERWAKFFARLPYSDKEKANLTRTISVTRSTRFPMQALEGIAAQNLDCCLTKSGGDDRIEIGIPSNVHGRLVRDFTKKDTGSKITPGRGGMTAILVIKTSEDGFVGSMEMGEGMTDWSHISVIGTSGLRILTTNLFLHGEKVRICIRILLVSVPATPSHI